MRICSHCGQQNDGAAKVCSSCQRVFPARDGATLGDLAQDPTALIGRILNGKYEVLEVLGEGGMGVVYKVRHLILKNRNLFALKILHPRFSTDKGFQERFLREVEVAMELTHENIVQIRDFGVTEHELLFFTMDFFAGNTLKAVLRRDGAFSPGRVASVAHSLLAALGEAHRCGVVHRDLKPENILIACEPGGDQVRILDFGIAKLLEGSAIGTNTLTQGGVIGTPKYMSPEQGSGEKVDARSDLYSLGVVLYEMLVGKAPFNGKTMRQIVLAHLSTPPPPFAKVRPDLKLPPRLERFVMRLLAKEPAKRPSSAIECIDLLHDTGTLPIAEATVLTSSLRRSRRAAGERWRRLCGWAALLAVSFGGGAALFVALAGNPFSRREAHASAEPNRASLAASDEVGGEVDGQVDGQVDGDVDGELEGASDASRGENPGGGARGKAARDASGGVESNGSASIETATEPAATASDASDASIDADVPLPRRVLRCDHCARPYPPFVRRARCPVCNFGRLELDDIRPSDVELLRQVTRSRRPLGLRDASSSPRR